MKLVQAALTGIFLILLQGELVAAHAMGDAKSYVPRALCIVLDDSEPRDIVCPAVMSVLTMLSQRACPFIVSAYTLGLALSSYHEPYDKEKIARDVAQTREKQRRDYDNLLVHAVRALNIQDKTHMALSRSPYVLLKASGFDDKDWIIKRINDDLYLLIPLAYIQQLGLGHAQVNEQAGAQVTPTELILGLKVNHMTTVDVDAVLKNPIEDDYGYPAYFRRALEQGEIFCTNGDYRNVATAQPIWTWYMEGHGSPRKSIVGMTIEDFAAVLDLMATTLTVRLLMYSSCYAAGVNAQLIYQDAYQDVTKTYPFAIITQAITDAPVSQLPNCLVPDAQGNMHLVTYASFSKFTQQATAENIDYTHIIQTVLAVPFAAQSDWGTVPQIKLPGLEWFKTVAGVQDVVSISATLAKARGDKPLDIEKYFKANPYVVVGNTAHIPFEIIINGSRLQAVVWPVPGHEYHTIKALTSTYFSTNDMLQKLVQVQKLGDAKILLIQSLQGLTKTGGDPRSVSKLSNVVVWHSPSRTGDSVYVVLYEKDGKVYSSSLLKSGFQYWEWTMVAHAGDPGLYADILSSFSGSNKSNSAEQWSLAIGRLSGNYHIPALIMPRLSLDAIFNKLGSSLVSEKDMVWVDTLKGGYPRLEPGWPALFGYDDAVLEDVVIAHKGADVYFTQAGRFYHNKKEIQQDYRPRWKQAVSVDTKEINLSKDVTSEQLTAVGQTIQKQHTKMLLKNVHDTTLQLLLSAYR